MQTVDFHIFKRGLVRDEASEEGVEVKKIERTKVARYRNECGGG